jgi:hypothetical protein
MALFMLGIFSTMVGIALTYPPQARFMPLVVGIPGIGLTLLELAREVLRAVRGEDVRSEPSATPAEVAHIVAQSSAERATIAEPEYDPSGARKREWILIGYFTGLIAGLLLFGFWIAVPVFITTFLKEREKVSWLFALLPAIATVVVLYFVFYRTLGIDLHHGFITEAVENLLWPGY